MSEVNGTYKISVTGPFGKQQGEVKFEVQQEKIHAKLRLMGTENVFEGTVHENEFEFQEKIKSGIFHVNVKIQGKIDGDKLVAKAITTYGTFPVTGVRETEQ